MSDGFQADARDVDALTDQIIQCIIKVHSELGPGFVESIYHQALLIELTQRGLNVETEKQIDIYYGGTLVGKHRLDLVVEDVVIVELKTIEELGKTQYAQVRSYLKAAKLHVALLVNFAKERADFRRVTRR